MEPLLCSVLFRNMQEVMTCLKWKRRCQVPSNFVNKEVLLHIWISQVLMCTTFFSFWVNDSGLFQLIFIIPVSDVGRHKPCMINVFWTTLGLSVHHLDTFVKWKFTMLNVQNQSPSNQMSTQTTHPTYLMIILVLLLNMVRGSTG